MAAKNTTSGQVRFGVELQGKTPMLLNRFTDEAQLSATSGVRASSVGQQQAPQEQAQKRLYLDGAGKCCIPGPNVFRCLIDGGTFFKNGKSKVTTQKTSLIPSCVEIEEITIPIVHENPWTVDTRPVRIPSTGGRILCHRPCFHDWRLRFTVGIDTTIMSDGLVYDILEASGKRIGIGDFRPACKGPFGKFVITGWKQI